MNKLPTFVSFETRLKKINSDSDIGIQIQRAISQLKKIRSAKARAKAAMHGGAFMLSEKVERISEFNAIEKMAEDVAHRLRASAFDIEDLINSGKPAVALIRTT